VRIRDSIENELASKTPTFLRVWADWQASDQPGQPMVPFTTWLMSLEERGGSNTEIDFSAEIVNEGARFCRAEITAVADGQSVRCHPAALDLPPNQLPQRVRILVSRPEVGDLIKAFDNAATLYGRTLTVVASVGGERAQRQWTEHVYTTAENSVREEIQQRIWRIGLGEGTEADFRAEAQSDLLRRHEERL
jgi:hypothetical protein